MPSEHDEGTVYVTERGREDDDFGVYVYNSTDFGRTFTSLAANIPAGSVNVIVRIRPTPSRLFLGTDFGVFVSTDGGKAWRCSAAICRRCRSPTSSTSPATASS